MKLDELKKYKLPLNLQFFAEDQENDQENNDQENDQGNDQANNQGNNGNDEKDEKDQGKYYTQEELDKILASRLAREKKKTKEAIEEAEKLAKMTADQKREYELEKLKEENQKLKAAQNRYELGKEASKILATSGIVATDEILDFVVKDDAEQTNAAVKAFTDLVDKVSDELMKEKLKGKTPKKNQTSDGLKNPFSKEHFNLTEQGRLLKENPELYNQLKAQAENN